VYADTGVPVEAECLAAADGLQCAQAGVVVVGDLAGVHLVGEAHALPVEHVQDGVPAVGEVLIAGLDDRAGTGGNIATYCQMLDPVNPTTVSTPILRATLAVSLSSSAARCRTPSASPSPHTRLPTMAWWRKSIGSSQTAWPLRWLETAQALRPCLSRISRRPRR
jgi:hypothetical protein